jgi:hypothetical protein
MATFDFGEAIKRIKAGKRVQRMGWNGKGMHIYFEDSLHWVAPSGTFKGQECKYEPVIVMFTAQGKHQPGWLASQADILSEDWQEVSAN